jgi:hypothetical protein
VFLILSSDVRMNYSQKIFTNNKGKIPVIIEKNVNEVALPDLEQSKYLFPEEFTFFDFSQVIRKKLEIGENQTITFFFGNGKLYQSKPR